MAEIIPERTLLLSGLSKSHAMTGWRIGYLFGPQDFVDQAVKSHQYMVTAPETNAQYAALEAMKNGKHDSDVMKAEYLRRRDFVKKELEEAGFEMASPDGAFYLFAKIPAKCGTDSWKFVRDLAFKKQPNASKNTSTVCKITAILSAGGAGWLFLFVLLVTIEYN